MANLVISTFIWGLIKGKKCQLLITPKARYLSLLPHKKINMIALLLFLTSK